MIAGALLFDADEAVAAYVAQKLACAPFQTFVAIGVLYRGELVGGIVVHNYLGFSIEVSAAFEHPRWCRRGVLRALFDYPFNQLKVTRIEASAARRNTRSRRLMKGLGFKEEGIRRKRYDGRDDLVMYGMLRNQCRWIN